MELFEAIQKRRSVRQFSKETFPSERIEKALEAAALAPNSSNVQTWDFHWIRSDQMMAKVRHACLNQAAARTANHLIVITADPKKWRRSQPALVNYVESVKAPRLVHTYYKTLIPISYRWGLFNSLALVKWIATTIPALVKPLPRGPYTRRGLQEVAVKSAALAAENFVLAITAQGGASCMMEGFDEPRMKRLLNLSCSTRVVMVIGVGFEGERGTWGPRFRLPPSEVIKIW